MAIKRIIKFILRLAVAAGIVVGAYFGIIAIFGGKYKVNMIANVARETKISTEAKSSTKTADVSQDLQYSTNNYVLKIKISAMDDINDVLVEYFNYYINLSCFENHANEGKRAEIVKKIKEVDQIIDKTSEYMTLVVSANSGIKEQRVLLTAKQYAEQIKAMFELDELLKEYVYEVNYNMTSTGIVREAQLEMMKDYSKAIFYDSIYGEELEKTSAKSNLTLNEETSFTKTYTKFMNKQELNINGDKETTFAWFYMNIDKTKLNEFYVLNDTDKQFYKNNSLSEDTDKMYFNSLYNYLLEANY